jgi:hypothetical protein
MLQRLAGYVLGGLCVSILLVSTLFSFSEFARYVRLKRM